jgi:NADH-quinone oxidoreductase subunit J
VTADALLFWFLALVTIISALGVVVLANPVFSALSLVMTMVTIAALFATLKAFFLAGVQLIVYAGAVMVLFVMVLMLFDLHKEKKAFTEGAFSGGLKLLLGGMLAGLMVGAVSMSTDLFKSVPESAITNNVTGIESTKVLGNLLITQYIFGFEILGVLLLVIAVGAVALARSKGGTHGA